MNTPLRSLGSCFEYLWEEAVYEWWRTEHKGDRMVDAIALHMEECEVSAKIKPGGRIEIMCCIADRDPVKSHGTFRRFYRQGPKSFYPAGTDSQPQL